ncbi:uncharacterized protein METZ01_LOCUS423955, partial [marine metagenome]
MGELVTGLVFSSMSSPPKESISKIDIVFGPQAALYGPDASQGLLNIIPKHPRHNTENEINFSASNLEKYRVGGRYSKIINEASSFDISFESYTAKELPYGNTERGFNGYYDEGENFVVINENDVYDEGEVFTDTENYYIAPLTFNRTTTLDTLHHDLYGELPTNRNYIRINYYHTLNNGNELNFASNFSTATGFAMGSYGPLFQDSFSSTTSIKYNSSNYAIRYTIINQKSNMAS